jgi:hypothetical protein
MPALGKFPCLRLKRLLIFLFGRFPKLNVFIFTLQQRGTGTGEANPDTSAYWRKIFKASFLAGR